MKDFGLIDYHHVSRGVNLYGYQRKDKFVIIVDLSERKMRFRFYSHYSYVRHWRLWLNHFEYMLAKNPSPRSSFTVGDFRETITF